MARRVYHAVVLTAAGPSESQLATNHTCAALQYSNRCGARRMHWRLKQQGISCMTANGSRLTRFLRAAPSSPALAFHSSKLVVVLVEALDSWKQGPAISRSSRAQLCLARSVICLLLPSHSETYERLFDNCRLYSRGIPVACMEDRHHPSSSLFTTQCRSSREIVPLE